MGFKTVMKVRTLGPTGTALFWSGRKSSMSLWRSCQPLRVRLQAPYRTGHLTADQEDFNSSIIKFRSSVEWIFSDITSYFAFLDFKKNLKIDLSPVCTIYSLCGLLRNTLTCFYGSSTSAYFNFPSPSIQEYFHF